MGASRDYTTGNDGYGFGAAQGATGQRASSATGLLDRGEPARGRRSTVGSTRAYTPVRELPGIGRRGARIDSPGTTRKRRGRLGSRQVASERGVRQVHEGTKRWLNKFHFLGLGLLLFGVTVAMWLSGVSTTQTFQVQQLSVQEDTLNNQIETLNRDLENVRSSADVARRATEDAMGVPVQAGIVEVAEDGGIVERRPATPETNAIIDVNGEAIRPGQASSDPRDTRDVAGNLTQVPQGRQALPEGAPLPQLPAQAPYAATAD